MKTLFAVLTAGLLLFGSAGIRAETQAEAARPGVTASGLLSMTARVEAIDLEKRLVTLRGADDRTVDIKVSEEARNLDQVKVGDEVTTEYFESFTIFARAADGSQPAVAEMAAMERAPKGEMPGMAALETRTITATVEGIDLEARTVTVKGPEGNTRTLNVDEQTPNLENLRIGDQVVARFTQAIAISVTRPE